MISRKIDSEKRKLMAIFLIFSLIAGAIVFSKAQEPDNKREKIKEINFQNRNGNIVNAKLYFVVLENGSEFKYSKTIPGPGMLCNTENPKGKCIVETEKGFKEIEKEISKNNYVKEDKGFSTSFIPRERRCIEEIKEKDIEFSNCRS